jgi:hypothetical protein
MTIQSIQVYDYVPSTYISRYNITLFDDFLTIHHWFWIILIVVSDCRAPWAAANHVNADPTLPDANGTPAPQADGGTIQTYFIFVIALLVEWIY